MKLRRMAAFMAIAALGVALGYGASASAVAADAPVTTVTGWGDNQYGQLDVPVALQGQSVTQISVGTRHVLALTAEGAVAAWGNNDYGQTDVPASLDGTKVTAVSAGSNFSLALTADGAVVAWGNDRSSPPADDWASANVGQTDVPASLDGTKVVSIAASYDSGAAITADGTLTVWGGAAEVGTPENVQSARFAQIAMGNFAVGLTDDGSILTWATASEGGDGTPVPEELAGAKIQSIAAGSYHAMALTVEGTIIQWGHHGNGEPTEDCAGLPSVLAGATVVAIADGSLHALAATSDGTIVDWGTACAANAPPTLSGGESVIALAAGNNVSFAVTVGPAVEPAPTAAPTETPAEPSAGTDWTPVLIGVVAVLVVVIVVLAVVLIRRRKRTAE